MSRYHRIKWRESDEQEVKRVLKNFNAKLKRIKKKNPQNFDYMPKFYDKEQEKFTDKLSVNQFKDFINTRQDLKRELNALKRFSKRGAEEIVILPNTDFNIKTTKWQKTEMNRRISGINRRRKARLEEIENIPMLSRGQELGYKVGDIGMGRAEKVALEPLKATTKRMQQSDLKWKWRSIMSESRLEYFIDSDFRLRENYIKGIKMYYDVENVKDVIEKIESMDISEFLNKFYAEGGTFEISSPKGKSKLKFQEYQSQEELLRSVWLPNK